MQKKWFTLIEMMIALGIFSVGILTILNLLINNLYFLDKASTRTQASLLAKEGIELVYNLRDSNLAKSYPWNCIPYENISYGAWWGEKICQTTFGSGEGKIFDIRFASENYYTITGVKKELGSDRKQNFENYEIFAKTWLVLKWEINLEDNYIYSTQKADKQKNEFTKYARYLVLKPLLASGVDKKPGEEIRIDNILKIESHVLYKNGTRTGEVIFESFIWNHD